MRNIVVPAHESFRFLELFKITELRDGCVYRTEHVGFIRDTDKELVDNRFVISAVSTKLTVLPSFTISVLERAEVADLMQKRWKPIKYRG